MNLKEYSNYDGLGLAELVKKGEVTALELAELALAGIEAVNPALNAVIETFGESLDQLKKDAPTSGTFAGVPTLLKDWPTKKGMTAEMGCQLLQGFVTPENRVLTNRLEEAGISLLGRTTSSEIGLAATTETRIYGKTCNPWDITRSVSGSSGGSAAAVAAGVVPFAHGGDGGGSIRNPAANCGLVGLKPSRGRISDAPGSVAPLWGMATPFMLTRTVRDCASLLDLLHGPIAGDYYEIPPPKRPFAQEMNQSLSKLKIAFTTKTWSGLPVDPELIEGVERVVKELESQGHEVVEATPEFDYEEYIEAQRVMWAVGLKQGVDFFGDLLGRTPSPENLMATTWSLYKSGADYSGVEFVNALDHYEALNRTIGAFFAPYDFMITPTSSILPAPLGKFDPDEVGADIFDQLAPNEAFTALFNATGQPAMSLPLFQSKEDLPIGIQFIGKTGDDAGILSLASHLEKVFSWSDRRPNIHVAKG